MENCKVQVGGFGEWIIKCNLELSFDEVMGGENELLFEFIKSLENLLKSSNEDSFRKNVLNALISTLKTLPWTLRLEYVDDEHNIIEVYPDDKNKKWVIKCNLCLFPEE
jgi:hypothetical protein